MKVLDYDKLDALLGLEYNGEEIDTFEALEKQVINAIPIPDNATNGDVIMAIFPNQTISCAIPITDRNGAKFYRTTINGVTDFTEDWWDAPYEEKRGNEE